MGSVCFPDLASQRKTIYVNDCVGAYPAELRGSSSRLQFSKRVTSFNFIIELVLKL